MKPLQGNLDFFLIRASRGPFRLKHKTQGPSHIHMPKGNLLFRWLAGVRGGGEYPFQVGFLPSTLRVGLRETTEGPTACGRAEIS